MSDAVETSVPEAAPVPAAAADPPKKTLAKKAKGPKKPASKPNHPPIGEMVNAAIASLKEKKGSSLQAIKKYIAATYKVDTDKQSTFIKKYLRTAVGKKILVQTKGSGAAGSFKLAVKGEDEKKKVAKKPAAKKKPAATKKPAVEKKVKKPAAEKKLAAVKKPSATNKSAKPKAAKPAKAKVVKPKKTAATKQKKAAAPKVAKPKAAKK